MIPRRLAVIDDAPDVIAMATSTLKSLSKDVHEIFEILSFTDPVVARDFFMIHDSDLILLDINMRDVSGFGFLKSVKAAKHFTSTVLMLTGQKTADSVLEAVRWVQKTI